MDSKSSPVMSVSRFEANRFFISEQMRVTSCNIWTQIDIHSPRKFDLNHDLIVESESESCNSRYIFVMWSVRPARRRGSGAWAYQTESSRAGKSDLIQIKSNEIHTHDVCQLFFEEVFVDCCQVKHLNKFTNGTGLASQPAGRRSVRH